MMFFKKKILQKCVYLAASCLAFLNVEVLSSSPEKLNDPNPHRNLYNAAVLGDSDFIQQFLSGGGNVNELLSVGSVSKTLLHTAAGHWYRFDIVPMLLEANADVDVIDSDGCTPLHAAASIGAAHLIKLLLAKKPKVDALNNNNESALCEAVRFGNADAVSALIAAGADVRCLSKNGKSLLAEVFSFQYLKDEVPYLADKIPLTRALIAAGANMWELDEHKLPFIFKYVRMTRCYSQKESMSMDLAQLLLKSGAKVDVRWCKRTPLHWIVAHSTITPRVSYSIKQNMLARLLFEYGVDVDAVDDVKMTPLQVVRKILADIECFYLNRNDGDFLNIVKYNLTSISGCEYKKLFHCLINYGADVTLPNEDKKSPLHVAVVLQDKESIQSLLDVGADVKVLDKDDKTPLQVAIECLAEADVDEVNQAGSSALDLKIARGRVEDARAIVELLGKEQ